MTDLEPGSAHEFTNALMDSMNNAPTCGHLCYQSFIVYFNVQQTWVKYGTVLDSYTCICLSELVWCIGTYDILSKNANPAFWCF